MVLGYEAEAASSSTSQGLDGATVIGPPSQIWRITIYRSWWQPASSDVLNRLADDFVARIAPLDGVTQLTS